MKFLADVPFAKSTLAHLRRKGHEAAHAFDRGLGRAEDVEIVDRARKEGMVVLTMDLDYPRLVALSGSAAPSLVLFRVRDERPAAINRHLDRVLRTAADDLADGAIVVVDDAGIRIHRLPVKP